MNSIALLVYNMVAEGNCLEIRSVGKPDLSSHIFNHINTGSVVMVQNTKNPQKCSLKRNRGSGNSTHAAPTERTVTIQDEIF